MREPKNTCPLIDDCIELLGEDTCVWEINQQLRKARSLLEDIREANAEIRAWGSRWEKEYEKLEEKYVDDITEKNQAIEELVDRLKQIEDELSRVYKALENT